MRFSLAQMGGAIVISLVIGFTAALAYSWVLSAAARACLCR